MANEPPSPEQVEAWIAGKLPEETASKIENYFERHPEELADIELEQGILKEASTADLEDSELTALIEAFKGQTFETTAEDQWMDLLGATDRPDSIGALEGYEIREVLAATGMATVLKAFDPELDRMVAIKILSHGLATHSTSRERFLREAKAMATLEHENILPIYGIHSESVPWFAMRFANGGSLQDALDANDPRVNTPVFIESLATQIASALSQAHVAGIIHRDIKPANILLNKSGSHAWLSDFGIARAIDDPDLTYQEIVAGTPRYMSPEQASGDTVDGLSDLFSLGSVLYHCATKRPPFEGDSSTAIIDRVKTAQFAPVRKLAASLPSWLSDLIDHLLERTPSDRPPSAEAVLEKLSERTQRSSHINRWHIAIPLILLFTFLTWLFWPPAPDEDTTAPKTNIILNQETGKDYVDLHRALAEADSGAILILDGWFVLEKSLITRTNFDLHLQAASGATPTIEFRHEGDYGLLVEGSTSAQGINFLCTERIEEGFQFLFARDAGKVEVTDCTFDDRIPRGVSWGVHGNATGQIVIDSCNFHGKELIACLLYDSRESPTARDGYLLMEDCQLEARAIALTRSRFPQTKFDITLKRNVFKGHTIIGFSKRNELRPTQMTLLDNQFTVSSRHIHVALGPLAKLAETLHWNAKGNTYTIGTPFVRISRPETNFIDTLDDFLKAIPNARDTGAKFHAPAEKKTE